MCVCGSSSVNQRTNLPSPPPHVLGSLRIPVTRQRPFSLRFIGHWRALLKDTKTVIRNLPCHTRAVVSKPRKIQGREEGPKTERALGQWQAGVSKVKRDSFY